MKRFLFIILILLVSCGVKPQEQSDSIVIRGFFQSLIENQSNTQISNTYLMVSDTTINNPELLNLQLDAVKIHFDSLGLQLDDLVISKYDEKSDDRILTESDKVYVAKNSKIESIYLLVENNRIRSFSTLNKGGARIFILN